MNSNTTAERAFFDALGRDDLAAVEAMVVADATLLDAFDYRCFGATPLTRVAFGKRLEMVQLLLNLGADINRRSDWQMGPWSPLHCAVYSRNLPLAQVLIERGAEVDAVSAAGIGDSDRLRDILDEQPEAFHLRGGDGCQPLHFADSIEVAQLLLERGADINARCIDHYSTPVQYLASIRPAVARYLFAQRAAADIFSASMAGDEVVVQRLLADNPQVIDERIDQRRFPPGPEHDVHNVLCFTVGTGCSPLHAAARGNQPGTIRQLIAAGHSPDARGGYDQQTPLHTTAWNNLPEAAAALLDGGADIDLRSGKIHNNSPAGWAIVAGSADAFELLMDRGASVLAHFRDDAQDALNGRFLPFSCVPEEQHRRIFSRLS